MNIIDGVQSNTKAIWMYRLFYRRYIKYTVVNMKRKVNQKNRSLLVSPPSSIPSESQSSLDLRRSIQSMFCANHYPYITDADFANKFTFGFILSNIRKRGLTYNEKKAYMETEINYFK